MPAFARADSATLNSPTAHLNNLRRVVQRQVLPWASEAWRGYGAYLNPNSFTESCIGALTEPRSPRDGKSLMIVLAELFAHSADHPYDRTSVCREISAQECLHAITRFIPHAIELSYQDSRATKDWAEALFYTRASHRREMLQTFGIVVQELLNLKDSARAYLEYAVGNPRSSLQDLEGAIFFGRR